VGEAAAVTKPPHSGCFQCTVQAIFEEFNTLSVIYQQPAALFVQRAQYQLQEEEPDEAQVRCWVLLLRLFVSRVCRTHMATKLACRCSGGGMLCVLIVSM
jgi:hypothetical protein